MKKKAKLMISTEDNAVKDPSGFFPSFVKDQFAKNINSTGKSTSKLPDLSSLKVIHLKQAKI